MVETMEEFRDKVRALREEMFMHSETADLKLVASWVDRLAIALEDLSVSLALTNRGMEALAESEPCCCSEMPKPAKKKAKPARKKAKPAKKKKRR